WGANGPHYSGNSAKGAAGRGAALAESIAEPNFHDAARMAPPPPRPGGTRHAGRVHASRYRGQPNRGFARNQQAVLEEVMSVVTTAFERSAAPPRTRWTHRAWHVLQGLEVMLDRLVPSRGGTARDSELPPEWFKYPPI